MAVGFDTVAFTIQPDDEARLALPVPDENGLETYTANVLLADMAAYRALKAYQSRVDVAPAMGGGGILTVTRGPGRRQLTIPLGGGLSDLVVYAVLVEIEGRPYLLADRSFAASCTWFVLGEVG